MGGYDVLNWKISSKLQSVFRSESASRRRCLHKHCADMWRSLGVVLPVSEIGSSWTNTWQEHQLRRGKHLLRTTSCWGLAEKSTASRSCPPSFFLLYWACLSSGIKPSEGVSLVWVGFELLLQSHKVGISERGAEWLIRWAMEMAATPTVHMKTVEEGLGRIMFVAGALEHERLFLGPLFKFLTFHPRNSVRRVPSYAAFILEFLARCIAKNGHYDCNEFLERSGVASRVDACAVLRALQSFRLCTRQGIGLAL